jgi:predicted RNA methylase
MPKTADNVRYCSVSGDVYDAEVISWLSGYEHPTQKPVELARRAIENSSKPGEIVADGFMGSGTLLIGAELTGRRAYGLEIDPTYAEVIIGRWQKLVGQDATLEATGETLEEVHRKRKPAPVRAARTGGRVSAARVAAARDA